MAIWWKKCVFFIHVHLIFIFIFSPLPPFSVFAGQRGPRRLGAGGSSQLASARTVGKSSVHAVFADWQLKEAASQRPLGGHWRYADPTVGIRRSSGAAQGHGVPASPRRGRAAYEVRRFVGPPAADLKRNDHQAAPCGSAQFRVHVATFPLRRCRESCSWDQMSLDAGCAIPTDRANQRGVNRELCPMEEGEPVGQHFNGSVVDDGRIQVHSGEGHVRCDACTRLAANARQCPLERHGAGPQDTSLCAGGAMVAEGVQRAATGAGVGTVGQWEPEASQQEDPEERILNAKLDGRGECGEGPAGEKVPAVSFREKNQSYG